MYYFFFAQSAVKFSGIDNNCFIYRTVESGDAIKKSSAIFRADRHQHDDLPTAILVRLQPACYIPKHGVGNESQIIRT